jgi:hypothetical protein
MTWAGLGFVAFPPKRSLDGDPCLCGSKESSHQRHSAVMPPSTISE